jgi:UDP-2,4-diacetamido-2,4,6-trideoxy-beta-L-altropyranose hydrolase
MSGPFALFRCDASPAIGGGHVMRCLTLADTLESAGWRTAFACAPGSAETVPALAAKRHLDPGASPGERASLAVVDHYKLDARDERGFREIADRILVIDDLADRPHDCDFLLDQTAGRTAEDYRPHVPPSCRLLLGSDYALLRAAFAASRAQALARRGDVPVERVLLSFGASDPRGYGVGVARALLARPDGPAIDLVADAAGLDQARALACEHPARLIVHFRTGDVARLMVEADLAAGAAGTTSWERCALGLPGVAVVTADNQRLIAERLAQAGAVDLLPETPAPSYDAVADRVLALASDGPRRATMSRAAAAMVDGAGARRVVAALS